jgi:hypothetical protein
MFHGILKEDSDGVYPVFVVMSHSGSVLSSVIRNVTKQPYTHASITFDTSLKNMYSFGSGKLSKVNYIVGGLAKENFTDIRQFSPDTTYTLYVTFVTAQERDAMLEKLKELSDKNNGKELRYNFIGLLFNAVKRPLNRDDAYFCSEFVDAILKAGNRGSDKHSSLVRPGDFRKLKDFQFITRGLGSNYDEEKVKQKLATISAKADQIVMYESDFPCEGGYIELM